MGLGSDSAGVFVPKALTPRLRVCHPGKKVGLHVVRGLQAIAYIRCVYPMCTYGSGRGFITLPKKIKILEHWARKNVLDYRQMLLSEGSLLSPAIFEL